MKILVRIIFLSSLFLSAGAVSAEVIKVGVSVPLSGPAATYGIDLKNVLSFMNARLDQDKFELVFEDDRCDPKEAVRVAQKFINIDKIRFVIGFPCSGAVLASAPVYGRAGIVMISALAGSPKISDAGVHVFRTRPTDKNSAQVLYQHVASKHKKLGVLVEQTDYTLGMLSSFEALNSSGELHFYREEFVPGETDFRASLVRLRTKGGSGLIIFAQTEQSLSSAVKQLSELQWHIPVFSSWLAESPSFLKNTGSRAEGIVFPALLAPWEGKSAEAGALYTKYVQTYGPLNSIAGGFECGYNAFVALTETVRSGEEPKKFLLQNVFNGLRDTFSFDERGDIIGVDFVLKKIIDGKPKLWNSVRE